MLIIFDEVALAAILVYYPNYERIHSEVHARITDLPLSSSLRDLRTSNLNNLVRVSGVVTRRTGVFPQLKYVKFDCRKCGAVLGPFYQDATKEVKISYCANCDSKGPFSVNSEQVRPCQCFGYFLASNGNLTKAIDHLQELSKDDFAGIPRLCASRPSAPSSRSHFIMGLDRLCQAGRGDCMEFFYSGAASPLI
jgi:hypothetical protein